MVTLGKGLGADVPLSAVLVNDRANLFAVGDHGGTFNGNPLMAAVGNAVLDVMMTEGFLDTVNHRAQRLRQGLETLACRYGGFVRGQGLLLALVLEQPVAEAVRDRCLELGLLVNAARPNVLRFMPELHVPETAIAEMLTLLEQSLRDELELSATPQTANRDTSTPYPTMTATP